MKKLNLFKSKLMAFTLAEILIVLTVIGVIATITIPQLTGGVDEAHYKAGLKKAYTTLANIAAIEKAEGNLPTDSSLESMVNFFIALNNNLDVEGYFNHEDVGSIVVPAANIKRGVIWQGHTFGDETDTSVNESTQDSPWIITADGMAFYLSHSDTRTCKKKSYLNAANTTYEEYKNASCLTIVIDINGLGKGPNEHEPKTYLTSSQKLKKLTGDRYLLYLAADGVAKGSPLNTITGRILAGEK